MSGFSMNFDVAGLERILAADEQAIQEEIRPAAQAGAQVLYEAVQRNVSAIGRKSGRLAASIYQAYSQKQSTETMATYHISWRTGSNKDEKGKRISSGLPTAPHGHLLEYGYFQRYKMYVDNQGVVRPMVRPGMEGQPKPLGSRFSQATKNAYWVPRPGGPVHVPGHAFVRRAADQFPQALEAMHAELIKRLTAKGVIK